MNAMMNLVFDAVTRPCICTLLCPGMKYCVVSFAGVYDARRLPIKLRDLEIQLIFTFSELLDSVKGLTSVTSEATVSLSGRIFFFL